MRISCISVAEFIENLSTVTSAEQVFEKTVYVSIDHHEVVEGKNQIVIQASAVIEPSQGNQYLLQCGEICGTDLDSVPVDFAGTRRSKELKQSLVDCCQRIGLRVLPGICSE